MAFFDKSRELLKTAQKIANDTIGEDNLSKIKEYGKTAVDAGSEAVTKTAKKLTNTISNYSSSGTDSKTNSGNIAKAHKTETKTGYKNGPQFISAACPQCGANLDVENGIDSFYCKYCGNKIVLTSQSDEVIKAKAAKQKNEHREKMADKVIGHLNQRAEQKAIEKERQRKNSNKTIIGCFVVMLLCMSFIFFQTHSQKKQSQAEEAQLQSIVVQIEDDITNGDYDSALVKANNLYYTSGYSKEVRKKWDNTRKALITQIEEAKSVILEKQRQEQGIIEPTPLPTQTPKAEPTPRPTPEPTRYISFGSYSPLIMPDKSFDLEWIILQEDDDKVLLLSDRIIETMPFQRNDSPFNDYHTYWQDCTLRKWLNDDFIHTAFTSEERKHILTSEIESFDLDGLMRKVTYTTEDKIFLLTREEFFLLNSIDKGAWLLYKDESSDWWLRDASYSAIICYITKGGIPNDANDNYYDDMTAEKSCGVRPAMWVDKSFIEDQLVAPLS